MPSPVMESVEAMSFYHALEEVATGKSVRRPSWPEHACLFLHADALHVRDEKGLHTLIVTKVDMEAADWQVVREP